MPQVQTIVKTARDAVYSKATEAGQRNAVVTALARYGYGKAPQILQDRTHDGAVVRVYAWYGIPAEDGDLDLMLVTGPSIEPQVKQITDKDWADAPEGAYKAMETPPKGAFVSRAEAESTRAWARVSRQEERVARALAPKPKPTETRQTPSSAALKQLGQTEEGAVLRRQWDKAIAAHRDSDRWDKDTEFMARYNAVLFAKTVAAKSRAIRAFLAYVALEPQQKAISVEARRERMRGLEAEFDTLARQIHRGISNLEQGDKAEVDFDAALARLWQIAQDEDAPGWSAREFHREYKDLKAEVAGIAVRQRAAEAEIAKAQEGLAAAKKVLARTGEYPGEDEAKLEREVERARLQQESYGEVARRAPAATRALYDEIVSTWAEIRRRTQAALAERGRPAPAAAPAIPTDEEQRARMRELEAEFDRLALQVYESMRAIDHGEEEPRKIGPVLNRLAQIAQDDVVTAWSPRRLWTEYEDLKADYDGVVTRAQGRMAAVGDATEALQEARKHLARTDVFADWSVPKLARKIEEVTNSTLHTAEKSRSGPAEARSIWAEASRTWAEVRQRAQAEHDEKANVETEQAARRARVYRPPKPELAEIWHEILGWPNDASYVGELGLSDIKDFLDAAAAKEGESRDWSGSLLGAAAEWLEEMRPDLTQGITKAKQDAKADYEKERAGLVDRAVKERNNILEIWRAQTRHRLDLCEQGHEHRCVDVVENLRLVDRIMTGAAGEPLPLKDDPWQTLREHLGGSPGIPPLEVDEATDLPGAELGKVVDALEKEHRAEIEYIRAELERIQRGEALAPGLPALGTIPLFGPERQFGRVAEAERYVEQLRTPKKEYARAYLKWIQGGRKGQSPNAPANVGAAGGQAVRTALRTLLPELPDAALAPPVPEPPKAAEPPPAADPEMIAQLRKAIREAMKGAA